MKLRCLLSLPLLLLLLLCLLSIFLCPLSLHLCPSCPFLCLISFLCFDFPFCFQLGEEGIPTEELEADLGEHLAANAANCRAGRQSVNLPFHQQGKTGCQQKQTMIHISEGEDEFNMFICLRGYTSHLFYQGPVNACTNLCLFKLSIIYRPKWHHCPQTPGWGGGTHFFSSLFCLCDAGIVYFCSISASRIQISLVVVPNAQQMGSGSREPVKIRSNSFVALQTLLISTAQAVCEYRFWNFDSSTLLLCFRAAGCNLRR